MAKLLVLLVLAILGAVANSASNERCSGFGYELLMAKLKFMEEKLLELQSNGGSKKEGKFRLHNRDLNERNLPEQIRSVLDLQTDTLYAAFMSSLQKLPSNTTKLWHAYLEGKLLKSCQQSRKKVSGRFWLSGHGFEVYCELTQYGGGWTVIQNRFDGSVNFSRGWNDYKEGFGDLDGEFWLGLDKIYQLTSTKKCELLVHLEDFDGLAKFAHYVRFAIGSEDDKYKLATLGRYNGTAGNALVGHKGFSFSTADSEFVGAHCPRTKPSGWWYPRCYFCNLNGLYRNGKDTDAMTWYSFHRYYRGLRVSKMMIREI